MKFARVVFPKVGREISRWAILGEGIPEPVSRRQAFASLVLKKFRIRGGSAYSLYPTANLEITVDWIIP